VERGSPLRILGDGDGHISRDRGQVERADVGISQ